MRPLAPQPDHALLEHVRRRCREDPDTGCWIWTGSLNRTGYNNTIVWPKYLGGDGRPRNGHVLAYIAANGPIPEGMEIDHLCRDRRCCNPEHLEAVPPVVNHQRSRPTGQLSLLEMDRSEWPALTARRARMRRAQRRSRPIIN